MDPVTLVTGRLTLRGLDPVKYGHVMTHYDDPSLMLFFGFDRTDQLEKEKVRFHEGASMYGKSFMNFFIEETSSGQVIGSCGFHTWYVAHNRAEIGYKINDDHQKGKGFMKEAMGAVLSFGFQNMKLHRVEAMVSPSNQPSLRLLRHFSFREEGRLREHYINEGKAEDSLVFSLLHNEWSLLNVSTS